MRSKFLKSLVVKFGSITSDECVQSIQGILLMKMVRRDASEQKPCGHRMPELLPKRTCKS